MSHSISKENTNKTVDMVLPVCYYMNMKTSQLLNKQLNQEFDEAAYIMNRLVKGNKKHQKSVRLHKQALKVINDN